MKTIISIIEVVMYNLFPAALATPVLFFIKDIIPLLGIALIKIGLHMMVYLPKFQNIMPRKLQNINQPVVDEEAKIAY